MEHGRETYRAERRAAVGFAATLAPTKVEVEAERQKAIVCLMLFSECGSERPRVHRARGERIITRR
jgi:hypothetical protein